MKHNDFLKTLLAIYQFTNPGTLKLPKEQIYRGGDSKSRNGRMQTMLRMVGFGDNAGSRFPAILMVWENIGWEMPELYRRHTNEPSYINIESYEHCQRGAEKFVMSSIDIRKETILNILVRDPRIAQTNIVKELGLSRKQVQTAIKELQDAFLVERVGSNRNGSWIVRK